MYVSERTLGNLSKVLNPLKNYSTFSTLIIINVVKKTYSFRAKN